MFDPEKVAELKTAIRAGESPMDPLAGLSQKELRRLKADIEKLLPKEAVEDLDLEKELVSQYTKTRDLMDEVLTDESVPTNQKAQVANSVVSTLGQLVKLQEDLRREQTLKVMEGCLVEVVKTLPEAKQTEFYAEYERIAEKAGLV